MKRKFIFFEDSQYLEEFNDFSNRLVYIQQDFEKFSRLVIWPNDNAIETLIQLLKLTSENYELLYILRASRCNNEEARYKIKDLSLNQTTNFLDQFKSFLQSDSRHRISIRSSDAQLTYFVVDEDNLILAYGDVQQFISFLDSLGFDKYNQPVVYPDPHMHLYHEEFDQHENEILNYFPWIMSELKEVDQ